MGKQATNKRLKTTLKTSPLGAWLGVSKNSKFWKGLLVSLSILDRPVFPSADFPRAEKADVVHRS